MCLEPRCRAESQSLAHLLPLSTTPAMDGDFEKHFWTSLSLSISLIFFFTTMHLETQLASVSRSLVNLVPYVDSSSQHSLTRHSESTSSESDFIAAAPTPVASPSRTLRRKLSFRHRILDLIVSISRARIAAVMERCCGHFRALLANSSRKASNLCRRDSVKIQFSLLKRRIGITHELMMDLNERKAPMLL